MAGGAPSIPALRLLRHLLDGARAVMRPGHGLRVRHHPSGICYTLDGTLPYRLEAMGLVSIGPLQDSGVRDLTLRKEGANLARDDHGTVTDLTRAAIQVLRDLAMGRMVTVLDGGSIQGPLTWGQVSYAKAIISLVDAGYVDVTHHPAGSRGGRVCLTSEGIRACRLQDITPP